MKKSIWAAGLSLWMSILMIGGSMVMAAEPAPAEEPAPAVIAVEEIDGEPLYESQELWLENGDNDIYGVLYVPLIEMEQYPVIIISHGFGGSADTSASIAEYFAEYGYVTYAYDFVGGGPKSRSGAADGDMSHMSVLTEASDLSAVIDQISELDYVNADDLFLIGQSQGGYVSAYVAAQRPEDIKALVLEFPAFALQDDCWERHGSIENVPETEHFMGQELGAVYSLDAMSMDIYEIIGTYTGDVLLLHGDNDRLVDLSYSERAADVYENAELVIYEGAGHGFFGDVAAQANEAMLGFIEEHVE